MIELEAADSVHLWDLDGTAIDSRHVFDRCLGNVLPRFGLSMPSSEVITANYHGVLTAAIKGALGDEVGDQLVGEVELAFLADQADAYDDIEPHFFPDAVALARYAGHMGVAQMVVTSRKHEGHGTASPRSIMQRSRFGRYMAAVVCGDDNSFTKPDPEVLGGYGEILRSKHVRVIGDQFVDMQLAGNLRKHDVDATGILVHRGGGLPPHIERLDGDWQDYVTVVSSLNEVKV